jgi:N-acetylglucosamine malate deacetylase 1
MTIFAVGCHPDDIEFMMAGTLFLLKDAGCGIHYMNVANGSHGTNEYGRRKITKIRRAEAQKAAALLGAEYHDSITDDLSVFYNQRLIRKLTYQVRTVKPDIMLIHSPTDYMEDHMNACRIAVTAAFSKGMRNYRSIPGTAPIQKDVVLYHALPHGLCDGLKTKIVPDFFVDISSVIDRKEEMLAAHMSQKKWLDDSQGFDSYLQTMRDISAKTAEDLAYAEGWRRHLHFGFSEKESNPLTEILKDYIH